MAPHFLSYVLSFIYLAIYWNNHHHMLHTVTKVDGLILWANSHLLFWLSLVPAATAWMGENLRAVAARGLWRGLLMPAIAYYLLQKAIVHRQGPFRAGEALGSDLKGKISPILYVAGIALAFVVLGFDRNLRAGRGDVARSRPAHRRTCAPIASNDRRPCADAGRALTARSGSDDLAHQDVAELPGIVADRCLSGNSPSRPSSGVQSV